MLVGASLPEDAAVSGHAEFETRLSRLLRKHRAMAKGYTTVMRSDGLIVVKPKPQGAQISGRSVLVVVVAFVLFKAMLIATLGHKVYSERVDRLGVGTPVERAGAFIMQIDPVSGAVAGQMSGIRTQLLH